MKWFKKKQKKPEVSNSVITPSGKPHFDFGIGEPLPPKRGAIIVRNFFYTHHFNDGSTSTMVMSWN